MIEVEKKNNRSKILVHVMNVINLDVYLQLKLMQ